MWACQTHGYNVSCVHSYSLCVSTLYLLNDLYAIHNPRVDEIILCKFCVSLPLMVRVSKLAHELFLAESQREVIVKTLDSFWKDHLVNMNRLSSAVSSFSL